jgi:hypothetical protein
METRITRRAGVIPLLAAGALALAVQTTAVEAQTRSLTWTESTRLEVPGALGVLLRATGATAPMEGRHAMHVQGRALIQESDDQTFVMDLDAGRWMAIDHTSRSYISMSFEDMAQMTQEALDGVYASAGIDDADAAAAREEWERTKEEIQATLEFRVSSESTGQRQRIGNYNAQQHFVTTEFEATAVPEGVDEPEGGSMIFLAELWQTGDVPTAESLHQEWARQLASDPQFRRLAEEMAASGAEAAEALAETLSTWNPEIGAGIVRMAEAMESLTGTTVRSTVTVALVPLGVSLDRAALTAWEPESMGDQLRAGAGDAARAAAGDAVRGAIGAIGGGRLGGLRGRGAPEPEPEPAAAPTARPLFRMITTREDIAFRESSEDVLGALQQRIADYRTEAIR